MAAQTAAATAERLRRSAHRAVDDPIALAKAARIVRAALAREAISLEDLTPLSTTPPPPTPRRHRRR